MANKNSSFAIVETGGKQYMVSEGKQLTIEKLPGDIKEGDTLTFDKVLLLDDGSSTTLGTPYINGATVSATLTKEGKGKKILVVKYKAKSRYFKRRGHRQPFMKVKVSGIK